MKRLLTIYILAVLTACNSSEKPGHANVADTTKSSRTSNENKYINEQPVKTIIDFIVWYRNNRSRIDEIRLVNNSEIYDSTKFYSVNFEGTEEYLKELKRSGFVSEKYIESWRQYFKKCDEHFKANPQNDGPPEGFDFNFIMQGQDYEQELADIEKSLVVEITGGNKSKSVKLKESEYAILTYDLSLINNKWYIDKIY